MTFGRLADHAGQLLLARGLAGQVAVLIEGGAGPHPGRAASAATDATGAEGGVADPLVVVAGGLLIAEAHGHGQVGVGAAGVADPLGAASQQTADAEIGLGVAEASRRAVVGDGLPRVAALQGGALAQGAHRLGSLAKGFGVGRGRGQEEEYPPAPDAESLHDGYLIFVSARYRF